jgi:hypothetical protein
VQLIILLYLIDNNEQTSWVILFGSGVGLLIEAWKVRLSVCYSTLTDCATDKIQITKAVNISVAPAPPGSIMPYKLDITGIYLCAQEAA